MAVRTKEQLKSYFETGDVPTEENFSDLIDTMVDHEELSRGLQDKQDTISDLATIRSGAGKGATAVQPSALANYATTQQLTELSAEVGKKQDTISDLKTIRSGAAKGATAIQEVKTINGESIVGNGNISISLTVDSVLSDTSTNPVQNKAIVAALATKTNESDVKNIIALEHVYFLYKSDENKLYFRGFNDFENWRLVVSYILNVTFGKPLTPHLSIFTNDGTTSISTNDFEIDLSNGEYKMTWVFNGKKFTMTFVGEGEQVIVSQQIEKQGVISQRQVWTQAADKGYDYTIDSNSIVRGEIPQANIDLLRANGIIFHEDSGYFECNGILDLSYNDAMNILAKTNAFAQGASAISGVQLGAVYVEDEKFRTNAPLLKYRWYMYSAGTFGYLCWNNQYIEILNLQNNASLVEVSNSFNSAFSMCHRLKKIENNIKVNNVTEFASSFEKCYSLESVHLKGIKKNVSFSDSARLNNESILYMIENSAATGITITLHPTAYARAEADAEIQAAKDSKGVSLAMV